MQSTCLTGGLSLGVLGTAASLAIAAPLAVDPYSAAAGTDASRIGLYFDRTGGSEKIGFVVMGTEAFNATATNVNFNVAVNLVPAAAATFLAGPAIGAAASPTFRAMVATDLPNTAVAPGAYTSADITVDAQGRITLAANGGGAPTLTATRIGYGSGANTLTGSTQLTWDSVYGAMTLTQTVTNAGTPTPMLTLIGAANTLMTVDTEVIDVDLKLDRTVQWATSTPTTQRAVLVRAPTYACDTVAQTITTAATFAIEGAPIPGTNTPITNPYALWVQSGASLLAQGTITAAKDALAITSTWNNAGVVFNSLLLDITDTARDNASAFAVFKRGGITGYNFKLCGLTLTAPVYAFGGVGAPGNGLAVSTGGHTGIQPGVEWVPFQLNCSGAQWSTGALTTQRFTYLQPPTISFVGASIVTTAATFAIGGAPVTGVNATITNSYALWVQSGASLFAQGTITAVSTALEVTSTWNQAGTAFTGASFNITDTASLEGSNLFSVKRTGTSVLDVRKYGVSIASTAIAGLTGSTTSALKVSPGAYTGLLGSGAIYDVWFNLARTVTFNAAAVPTTQIAVYITAPTYANSAGGATITTAATLSINAAPIATGGTLTITNAYALWVQAGRTQLAGGVNVTGATTNSITQLAATGGVMPTGLTFTGAAHTGADASAEGPLINFNFGQTYQFNAGALATQRTFRIQPCTYAFVGASILADADTVGIDGPPTGGANATITESCALHIRTRALTNVTTGYGLNVAAPSGATNNFAINASGAMQLAQGTITTPATALSVTSTWNAAATFAGLQVNITDNSSNIGSTYLDVQRSGVTLLKITRGGCTLASSALAAASPSLLRALDIAPGGFTNMTAGSELNDVRFGIGRTVEWATGNITTQRAMVVFAPTYAFVGASTITTAATVSISGAPAAGANATITNSLALWVQAGATSIEGLGAARATAAADTVLTKATFYFTFTGNTAAQTITLPSGVLYGSTRTQMIFIRNKSSVSVTVAAAGGQTIDGAASIALPAGAGVLLLGDGAGAWDTN